MEKKITGSCLCGEVKYKVWGPYKMFRLCHCSRCQKASGTAHVANVFTDPDNVEWVSGENQIKRYDLPEAESFGKCFCTNCGSVVPYKNRPGSMLIIPAGTLDEDPGIRPDANIFWPNRACWYDEGVSSQHSAEYP